MLTNTGNYAVVVSNPFGSVMSAVAAVTVVQPSLGMSPGGGNGLTAGGFNLQLSVPSGHTYVIFASTDLQNWTPILTNVAASASVAISDSSATNFTQRYYRAIVQ
jgi:hypothetical protein